MRRIGIVLTVIAALVVLALLATHAWVWDAPHEYADSFSPTSQFAAEMPGQAGRLPELTSHLNSPQVLARLKERLGRYEVVGRWMADNTRFTAGTFGRGSPAQLRIEYELLVPGKRRWALVGSQGHGVDEATLPRFQADLELALSEEVARWEADRVAMPNASTGPAEPSEGRILYPMVAIDCADGTPQIRFGYMDDQGAVVIPPQYDRVVVFSGGVGEVGRGKKWGYVDSAGRAIVPIEWDKTYPLTDGLALAHRGGSFNWGSGEVEGGEWVYFDAKGQPQIRLDFARAKSFSCGRALVKVGKGRGGRFGFIDKKGSMAIPAVYRDAWPFSDGVAPVEYLKEGFWKWKAIDVNGNDLFEMEEIGAAYHLIRFSEGLSALPSSNHRGAVGYVDKTGKWVIQPRFEQASIFIGGLAKALKDGKWGYIDQSGKYVIEPMFTEAHDFTEGLAYVVHADGRKMFIDRTGAEAISVEDKYSPLNGPPRRGLWLEEWRDIGFWHSLAVLESDDGIIVINKRGKVVFKIVDPGDEPCK